MITNRLIFRRVGSWIAAAGARRSRRTLAGREPAILSDDFIFTRTPVAMSHASSIAKCGESLVAAWFAGSLESRPDVGIWIARNDGHGWSTPVEVAHGGQEDGTRHACWNPVLFQPASGPLLLFYKVGRNPRSWRGMCMASSDGGRSWTAPQRLPEGILGPIKNKPVQLAGGVVLSPSSAENDGWRIHLERSTGAAWTLGTQRPAERRQNRCRHPAQHTHPRRQAPADTFPHQARPHRRAWVLTTAPPGARSG